MKDFFDTRVIAIIRGISGENLVKVVSALEDGGIKMAEVTLNSPEALSSIEELRELYKDRVHIGAGTVTNLKMAKEAIAAGAEFIVTPNIDPEVIKYCVSKDILITPGAFTPTEIDTAMRCGSEYIKLFPVGNIGAKYIRDILAPFNNAKVIAVGGVTAENCRDYMANGAFGVGVGGNLCKIPDDGNYGRITEYAKLLIDACKGAPFEAER